jgi:hypothetical protein
MCLFALFIADFVFCGCSTFYFLPSSLTSTNTSVKRSNTSLETDIKDEPPRKKQATDQLYVNYHT